MAATLAEIRAKLQAQADKVAKAKAGSATGPTYPHWDLANGGASTLRFLPDNDPSNEFFWVEKQVIKLPFPGIKNVPQSKAFVLQVPCVEQWEDMGKCQILETIRPWFKDPDQEAIARTYWKKKSFCLQGFVRKDGIVGSMTPENPIRKFVMSAQIFNIIKAAIMDPEMENLPIDYDKGLDFVVNKGMKGAFADYSTSKWSRKESKLTQEELDAITKYGLNNLSESMGVRPDQSHLDAIFNLFEDSIAGRSYDPDRFAKYYKPYSVETPKEIIGKEDSVEEIQAKMELFEAGVE